MVTQAGGGVSVSGVAAASCASFTIITTEPNELVRPIHNRMPVVLLRENEEQWLDTSRTPFAKAKSFVEALSR